MAQRYRIYLDRIEYMFIRSIRKVIGISNFFRGRERECEMMMVQREFVNNMRNRYGLRQSKMGIKEMQKIFNNTITIRLFFALFSFARHSAITKRTSSPRSGSHSLSGSLQCRLLVLLWVCVCVCAFREIEWVGKRIFDSLLFHRCCSSLSLCFFLTHFVLIV